MELHEFFGRALQRAAVRKASDRLHTAALVPGLLPCHRHLNGILGLDEVIKAHRILGNGELHSLDGSRERVLSRFVILRDRGSGIPSDVAAIVSGEDHGRCRGDVALAHLLAIDEEGCSSSLPRPPPA